MRKRVDKETREKNKKAQVANLRRREKIKTITKNINVDLTNYRFNREEANNYDE